MDMERDRENVKEKKVSGYNGESERFQLPTGVKPE